MQVASGSTYYRISRQKINGKAIGQKAAIQYVNLSEKIDTFQKAAKQFTDYYTTIAKSPNFENQIIEGNSFRDVYDKIMENKNVSKAQKIDYLTYSKKPRTLLMNIANKKEKYLKH